jgi:chaperone required for assembly of F1-ATPase
MMHQRGLKSVLSSCCSSNSHRVLARFDSSGPRISLSNVHQTISGRQRFYKLVDVVPVLDTNGVPTSNYKILLDGRSLRTPAGNNLHLPNIGLALSIAAEWDAQRAGNSKGIQPATMPLMTLAATAIDQILPDGYQVKKTCLSYLPTDTALFLTAETDRILLRKQRQHFQPILRCVNHAPVEFK